jgi:ATP/maltotriose-dependent transcriptional regulator MalT
VTDDPKDPGHDQARRVIEAYQSEWLAHEPILLAIMHMLGLFDRPARADCIMALRSKPVIDGLTNGIVDLDDDAWRAAIARLRQVRLLDPEDSAAPDALDAHPLVREWFGDRLKQMNDEAWKTAHGRLYEYLRDTTVEGKTPSLEDLGQLYQAIVHGCRAGRHQDALEEIYVDRICQREPDGGFVFYPIRHLGALGSDLAAISWFFEKPYETPVSTLTPAARSFMLSTAAYCLRAQGRFTDALPAMREALRMTERLEFWANAATAATNLSETELLVGEVAAAVVTAKQSVIHADSSADKFAAIVHRTTHANALHVVGHLREAERLFIAAERLQAERQHDYPLLYSLQGFHYCELVLAKGDHAAAFRRAIKLLEWQIPSDSLLTRALVRLALGRIQLVQVLSKAEQTHPLIQSDNLRAVCDRINEAIEGLRIAGRNDFLPRGLLTRVVFRRSIGDWDAAKRDLDEVEEITEPGPMKLYLCDMALERVRLALSKMEPFAPLIGLIENNRPKPVAPDSAETKRLKEEAVKQLAIAANYIKTCGYHKRDKELAELQTVLRGKKKFAKLPPRV